MAEAVCAHCCEPSALAIESVRLRLRHLIAVCACSCRPSAGTSGAVCRMVDARYVPSHPRLERLNFSDR